MLPMPMMPMRTLFRKEKESEHSIDMFVLT
jgi:hypothetical protein